MNIRGILNFLHQTLGQSRLIVRLVILLRNQSQCIIKYHLNEGTNPLKNGEAWLAQLIAPDSSTFVDVGANVGNWSSLFIESTPKPRKGLLFEPSDYAAIKLKKRFAPVEQIEIVKAAVSDALGEMSFFEEPEAGETSSLLPGVSNPCSINKIVTVTTLDAEVEKHQLQYIDFLKIDAEGYDLHVLRGASDLLARQKIGVIQFEYGGSWAIAGSTLARAYNLLNGFGYQTFLLKSNGLFDINYNFYGEFFNYSNFVAISPQKMPKLQPYLKGYL